MPDTARKPRRSAAQRKADKTAADAEAAALAAAEANAAAEAAEAAKAAQDAAAEAPDEPTDEAPAGPDATDESPGEPKGEAPEDPAPGADGEPETPDATDEPEAPAQPGGALAAFLEAAGDKIPELPDPKAPKTPRANGNGGGGAASSGREWPAYAVDEVVGVRSKPGQRFTITKVNPESLVLKPAAGGDTFRIWKAFITEAPAEGQEPADALAPGSLAKWTARPQPEQGVDTGDLVVILADNGNTINGAKLGGYEGKTLHRSPRHCFEPVEDLTGALAGWLDAQLVTDAKPEDAPEGDQPDADAKPEDAASAGAPEAAE